MKERLDKILFERGLVKSRETARALVIEGKVYVDGKKTTKPGTPVADNAELVLKEAELPYVGRGGLKLEAALNFFGIDIRGMVAMDVGASTGGFTDCLLQRGAQKVYSIDVGYGQLAWSLRKDPRVVVLERTNVRYLGEILKDDPERFARAEFAELVHRNVDMVTFDVSFISLTKVVPEASGFLKPGGEILALVKPQFEAGKGEVGKGGIIRDEEKRLKILEAVVESLKAIGLELCGTFESPVAGQKGNREYFVHMRKADTD